jgi:hypothetical protein
MDLTCLKEFNFDCKLSTYMKGKEIKHIEIFRVALCNSH